MATQSKAQFLNEVHTLLKKRYKPKADRSNGRLTVLEAVIYGICHEETTREQANQALSRFKDGFFDWNEVRVSSIEEIQSVLAGMPDAEGRATADPPLPPPVLREDLRLHPRGPDQEAAQGRDQVAPGIRGARLRLRPRHRDPAGPGRPRHPGR